MGCIPSVHIRRPMNVVMNVEIKECNDYENDNENENDNSRNATVVSSLSYRTVNSVNESVPETVTEFSVKSISESDIEIN